jgi:hypothetical protein
MYGVFAVSPSTQFAADELCKNHLTIRRIKNMTTENKVWTIQSNDVHGGSNKTSLVGCHIAVIKDMFGGHHYQFQTSDGTGVTATPDPTLPALPFNFPVFTSNLDGPSNPNPPTWYITVESLTHGANKDEAKGVWSNTGFPTGPIHKRTDPDTWTAQKEQGDDVGDEAAAAAASAQ